MALTIDKVHQRINFLIKKNKWGYTSPQDIDICLDLAQTDLFNFYYGDPSKYQYGRAIPPVAHGQTQKLHDSLSRFLKPWILNGSNGFNAFPSDYVHLDSAYIIDQSTTPVSYHPLPLVTNDRVAYRSNSQLLPVSKTNPTSNAFISITPEIGSGDIGVQVYPFTYPANVSAIAYYLSRPVAPLYSYTQTGRVITYVPSTSINLEWGDEDIQKIILGAIEYIAVNLEDDKLFQQGQLKYKE